MEELNFRHQMGKRFESKMTFDENISSADINPIST